MVNIKEVADLAKVSTTTVSHVINNTRYVSDELVERVNKAMEELNYHPNSLARGLRSGKTKTIGLVIPDISNQFFAEISRKIEDKGFEYDYSVILCDTDDDVEKENRYIDVLIAKQVDGIIFISAGGDSVNLNKIIDMDISIVVIDRDIQLAKTDIVLVDNSVGGYEATGYLIELGHRRIACITGSSPTTPSAQRVAGYKKALQKNGIALDPCLIVPGDYHFNSGYKAMQELLSLSDPPTAVFACNDMMALGAIQAANEKGMKIPEDISVIGFDNIPFSQTVFPTLTTVAQPINDMAELAVDLLIEKIRLNSQRKRTIKEPPKYCRKVLKTKLLKRNSCREI